MLLSHWGPQGVLQWPPVVCMLTVPPRDKQEFALTPANNLDFPLGPRARLWTVGGSWSPSRGPRQTSTQWLHNLTLKMTAFTTQRLDRLLLKHFTIVMTFKIKWQYWASTSQRDLNPLLHYFPHITDGNINTVVSHRTEFRQTQY